MTESQMAVLQNMARDEVATVRKGYPAGIWRRGGKIEVDAKDLRALCKKGMIAVHDDTLPDVTTYRITDDGKAALRSAAV